MLSKILLSKQKIEELKVELKNVKADVRKHHEEEHENMRMSYREAASFDVTIGSKQARLKQLEKILKSAEVLSERVESNKAVLGSWVELEDENGDISKYRLVHPLEAEPAKGLLSVESPLGKLLLGKLKGDITNFNNRKFAIQSIN